MTCSFSAQSLRNFTLLALSRSGNFLVLSPRVLHHQQYSMGKGSTMDAILGSSFQYRCMTAATFPTLSVKHGTAKNANEGLSLSGDHYQEAVDCLMSRYNQPRLIHRAHVRVIMEAPSLKDGNGKELRRLHDTIQQHLRALKSMKCELSGPFSHQSLNSNWMLIRCSNGRNTARSSLKFPTMMIFWNLLIFGHKHQKYCCLHHVSI